MDVTVLMLLLKLYLMSKVLLPLSGLHHCTDEAKVQEEKDKLAKYQQMLEQVKEQIARIS